MRSAVIVFPGSNCDRDCASAILRTTGFAPTMVWHAESVLDDALDLVVLPGGFSYGDYLRPGAMAALSPIMTAVQRAAERGTSIVGVCNGFQILCEAGLLPGALLRNVGLRYVCKPVALEVVNAATRFTCAYAPGRDVVMPVGNGDGAYYADDETLDRLEGENRVVFRYRDNPNGSARNIAAIVSAGGNVLGVMPHPDRAFEPELGSADGAALLQGLATRVV